MYLNYIRFVSLVLLIFIAAIARSDGFGKGTQISGKVVGVLDGDTIQLFGEWAREYSGASR